MDEELKYETIKSLADHPDRRESKLRAACTLGCTVRTINRMLKGYREQGKAYFVHGNRGREPANAIPEELREQIIKLYLEKYYDTNFTHFSELLESIEGITVSPSCVASILESKYILSPKVTKKKQKRILKELEESKKDAKTQKEADIIQANLVSVEEAHSRRPRCTYFGEMQQMDASSFLWFGDEKTTLHASIDDASGNITGLFFDKEETLDGYYHVLEQILTDYGIPYKLFTDCRTVFTYKKKNSPSIEDDTYTQFAYACKQLGITIEVSSVPQAKGRVERLFETLQSRLPVELRLAGVTTIEEANEFLKHYIKKFNDRFAIPQSLFNSVFESSPSDEKINQILAVLSERTVDCGHCIKYANHYYRMLDANGMQVHYLKGTKVMVIKAFDKSLYCCVNDMDVYVLEEIPEHEKKSKEFDTDYEKPKPKKQHIPKMSHPWRMGAFSKFAKSQPHHWADEPRRGA